MQHYRTMILTCCRALPLVERSGVAALRRKSIKAFVESVVKFCKRCHWLGSWTWCIYRPETCYKTVTINLKVATLFFYNFPRMKKLKYILYEACMREVNNFKTCHMIIIWTLCIKTQNKLYTMHFQYKSSSCCSFCLPTFIVSLVYIYFFFHFFFFLVEDNQKNFTNYLRTSKIKPCWL